LYFQQREAIGYIRFLDTFIVNASMKTRNVSSDDEGFSGAEGGMSSSDITQVKAATDRLIAALFEARHRHPVGCDASIRAILEALTDGADPNARMADGTCVCCTAAYLPHGHAVVAALIANGCQVNACGCVQRSPLHPAVRFGTPDTVDALLLAGADVNTPDCFGRSPLMQLAWRWPHDDADDSAARIISVLLDHGDDLNACRPIEILVSGQPGTVHSDSALYAACILGNAYIVEALLDAGANPSMCMEEVRKLCGPGAFWKGSARCAWVTSCLVQGRSFAGGIGV